VRFEGENILVGLVCLALVPLIAVRLVRGLRNGSLPVYRTQIQREEDRAKFTTLLILHIIVGALMAFIAADLLLGLGFRD
jgi:hypothetical protein